jgi:hypothetical protein
MVLSAVPVVRHTKFMVVLVEKYFFLPVTEKAHRYSKKIMEDINAKGMAVSTYSSSLIQHMAPPLQRTCFLHGLTTSFESSVNVVTNLRLKGQVCEQESGVFSGIGSEMFMCPFKEQCYHAPLLSCGRSVLPAGYFGQLDHVHVPIRYSPAQHCSLSFKFTSKLIFVKFDPSRQKYIWTHGYS